MKAVSLSEAKAKLSQIVDRISKFEDEILITKNGHAAAVMISPEEYESWKETLIIKNDAVFFKEIRSSLKKHEKHAHIYSLEDIFKK